MTDFSYVIDTRTGVKRRFMPGDAMRDGEVLYMGMEVMHRPATRKLSDAAVATFIRDSATGSKPDAVPPGFFRDAYGRLLATGTGPERDRAEGFRIARDAMLADAYKAGDDAPAAPAASLPDAKTAYDAYIADITNAHRRPDPDLSERAPVAFGGGKRRESA
ncbi:hypothetical protein [Xanthobacter autotrophicus]|uniref:hypothetical protein n=1 Tax=Xanthobacter autotrophicus TaxID=280 RepID=UPI00372AFF90